MSEDHITQRRGLFVVHGVAFWAHTDGSYQHSGRNQTFTDIFDCVLDAQATYVWGDKEVRVAYWYAEQVSRKQA